MDQTVELSSEKSNTGSDLYTGFYLFNYVFYFRITGPIPPELGNTSKLSYLQLQDNQLAGTIPAELGKLEQLFELTYSTLYQFLHSTESIETKYESAMVSPANGDVETALKVKEWEIQSEGNTPRNILEDIIWHKDVEVAQLKERRPLFRLKNALDSAPPTKDFVGALRAAYQRTGLPGLIAEVKKASPSRGILREDFDPVHNEREMDCVLGIEGVELISINNRNLETFEVDISNTKKFLEGERGQKIREKDIIVVGESGLFTPNDIAYVQEAGVKAVLVGESIVKQSDPGKGIAGLFGKDISP
ncbi:hypothetical protein Q3G72_014659 [Acer saccharum]|nr:hypothetical protein Q3G72_014659 [Acer saccharum]